MQQVVTYSQRLAAYADRLPPATEKTADLHTSIQMLTDDLGNAAHALRTQCLAALEGFAAVQGLSCPDELMDEILHRIFSGSETVDALAAEAPMLTSTPSDAPMLTSTPSDAPMLTSMSSSDAITTSQFLSGILAPSRSASGRVEPTHQDRLDALLTAMPTLFAAPAGEGCSDDAAMEERAQLRTLSHRHRL